jgi:pyridoxal phosphate enzyme (YggS family)
MSAARRASISDRAMTSRPSPPALSDRIGAVRARIAAACERAGRSPDHVTLIAVTKTHSADAIAAAYSAGLRDFGENRVQEALPKIEALRDAGITPRWHLVGHLQTNKVRSAVEAFDILHSVDSERLARAISERALQPVPVLLEVNAGGEQSKFGVAPQEAGTLAEIIGELPNVELRGLMTVAPRVEDPEDARPVFRLLRELRDAIGVRDLSMGMTDDFEVAIEEGSTMVRVGRAIFGARAT